MFAYYQTVNKQANGGCEMSVNEVFTDDELKQFKKAAKYIPQLKFLLARLEAAEYLIECTDKQWLNPDAEKAWLQAAGK